MSWLSDKSVRKGACVASLIVVCIAGRGILAADPDDKSDDKSDLAKSKRLMIVPFENVSNVHQNMNYQMPGVVNGNGGNKFTVIDRYAEEPRAALEEAVSDLDGVKVVERSRVDAILQEQQFGGLKGITDPVLAAAAGKVAGATTIVIGKVNDLSGSKTEFHGNGINVVDFVADASIQVRVVDIETSVVVAEKTFKGEYTARLQTGVGGTTEGDAYIKAIDDAMEKIPKDKKFLAKISGNKADTVATVKLEIACSPANADVSIDDNYVGSSPTTVDVPAGKKLKVTLHKAGYTDWSNTVVPKEGMKITPELEKKPDPVTAAPNVVVNVPATQPSK